MTRAAEGSQQTAPLGAAPAGAADSVSPTRRSIREHERGAASRMPQASATARGPVTQSAPIAIPPVPQAIARATAPIAPEATFAGAGAAATTRRRRQGKKPHGFMRSAMSMAAMLGVAAILVSTTIPGGALQAQDAAEAVQAGGTSEISADVQSLGLLAGASVPIADAVRDSYSAKAYVKPVPKRGFATPGNANFTYTNNPGGSIQWPFPSPAPITYGFGPRAACSFCSTFHLGVDFTPGSGVPIQAITDGVVSKVVVSDSSLGNYVVIDHVVNGQRIQSAYAHMQWGSIQVAVGQQVSVGTIVGLVGSTGASTGAHLHLEIHADGTAIDPFAWLKANAN